MLRLLEPEDGRGGTHVRHVIGGRHRREECMTEDELEEGELPLWVSGDDRQRQTELVDRPANRQVLQTSTNTPSLPFILMFRIRVNNISYHNVVCKL